MRRLAVVALASGCFFEPNRPFDPDASSGDAPGDPAPSPNYVFVTSNTVVPWMLGGLSAADQVCMEAARVGNLPGTYVAWLSTSSVDAIHRLDGSRGWIRPGDRMPVADLPEELVTHLLYPPKLDERGNPIPAGAFAITGSDNGGLRLAQATCNDYTSTTAQYELGFPDAGGTLWTMAAQVGCGTPGHLYCFGTSPGLPLDALHPGPLVGFVTAGAHPVGAGSPDAICQTSATGLGMSTNFRAFIATTTSSAKARFIGTPGPWYRLDGVEFTTNLDTFDAPLAVTDAHTEITGDVFFGALDPNAMVMANTCGDWTSTSGSTNTGDSARSTSSAFSGKSSVFNCAGAAHYYCLEY